MNCIRNFVLAVCIFLLTACSRPHFDISTVQSVSKLAALEVKLDKMLFATKEKKLFGFLLGGIKIGETSYIADTEATLLIGIDAGKMRGEDVKVSLGKISLLLPPIEILDFSYPAASFIDNNLYTKDHNFKVEDKEKVYQEGEREIRALLPYLKLEKKAQEKTKLILVPILANMGFEEIDIDFHPSNDFEKISE